MNKLIVKEDKVTREQVDKLDKLIVKEDKVTREQGVSTYNVWGEKGLKKARD